MNEREPPAGVLAGAIIFAMVIILWVFVQICAPAILAKKDPKTRKPTGEIIVPFNEAGVFESWVACPDCGLTQYVHIQLRGPVDQQVAVITLWYDRTRTAKARRRIFGTHNPFDPLGGLAAGSDPFK